MPRNIFRLLTVILALGLCSLSGASSLYAESHNDVETGYVTGQVIVKFKPTLRASAAMIIKEGRRFQDYLTNHQSDSLDQLIKKLQVFKVEHLSSSGNDLLLSARRENRKIRLRRNLKKRFAPFSIQQREEILSNLPDIDHIYSFHIPENSNIEKVVATLQNNRHVEYAQPNYLMKLSFSADDPPNDPFLDEQWGLKNMEMEKVWDVVQGQGMVVAVVDSGVDINHPDIVDNIWKNPNEIPDNGIDDDKNGMDDDGNIIDWINPMVDDVVGWDFINFDNDPQDGNGHGTNVAGIIASMGNNDEGIIGVAPNAKIMIIKALNDEAAGSTHAVSNSIIYAAEQRADVVNVSVGCANSCSDDPVTEDAVRFAHGLGCVIVVSAGNSNMDVKDFSPENLTETITVAAIDANNSVSDFSNFGKMVDVAAPGRNIISLNANKGDNAVSKEHPEVVSSNINYRWGTGSSFAAPYVSGLAALILQHFPADGSLTLAERADFVKKKLIETSLPVTGKTIGGGRVNAARAILGIPPEIDEIADKTVNVGNSVVFTVMAEDVDDKGSELTLTASLGNGDGLSSIGATFKDNGNGTADFVYTAAKSHVRKTLSFVFEAKDSKGLTDDESVSIKVKRKRLLRGPRRSSKPQISNLVNAANNNSGAIIVDNQPDITNLTVNPNSANSSLLMKDATVTVAGPHGIKRPGVMVNASASGIGVVVTPDTAITDANGEAKFRFRFEFVTNSGEITFTAGSLCATIKQ